MIYRKQFSCQPERGQKSPGLSELTFVNGEAYPCGVLNVKPEVDDVAVLHFISFSLDRHFAGFTASCFRA